MNRQLFKWISELVTDKPTQTTERRVSAQGKSVLERYHCGHEAKNRLVFTPRDKLTLRRRVKDELGLDPFTTPELPDDRIAMAKYHGNEKLAAKPASHDHLLLNGPDGKLRLNGRLVDLQSQQIPSAGLFCLNNGIETVEHEVIVVVENLAIMSVGPALQLPPRAQSALWVYRGDHKTGAKADICRQFLTRFGAEKTVIVFGDMDPEGLEIALTMPHADYWMGPAENVWRTCLRSRQANRDGFDLQSQAVVYLQHLADNNTLTVPMKNLLECLRQERSTYRQEHMASHRIPLDIFSLAGE
ncbi:DUF7281 domain-containing protein [Methylomarinum vadi]|uniref:DUF7281 domain-containing protein n=1 Tax=Methylomarinum vadi TaxID=438855 RepID=UPI0004DFAC31|nr:hypothetical protein [Methylomarinum vadi]